MNFNLFFIPLQENNGKTGNIMEKELIIRAIDTRRVETTAMTAKAKGLEAAVNDITMAIMKGDMPLGDFIGTFVRLSVKASTDRLVITPEQLMSLFSIVGMKDFTIVGRNEARGRKGLTEESTTDRMTWDRLFSMDSEEFLRMTGMSREDAVKALSGDKEE